MNKRIFQVYGVGQCSLDYIASIENYPPPDAKCEYTQLVIQAGGPVATGLTALAQWGISCAFTGVVGDDEFGKRIMESLETNGVDIRGLLIRKGFQSQFAFIATEPGMARRTIFWHRPTGSPPCPEELNTDLINHTKLIYTDGLFMDAALAASKLAKKAGKPVLVDAGTLREGMLDLARTSDYFIVSESFAQSLSGPDVPREACQQLAALGPRLVCVTLGEKGYVALTEGRFIEKPAYRVDAVDTTGCGDVFHAGFAYGLIRGWTAAQCLDCGAWCASRASLKLGAVAGIPSIGDYDLKKG